jgi:peptide/nickel transport system substrate-binding protein
MRDHLELAVSSTRGREDVLVAWSLEASISRRGVVAGGASLLAACAPPDRPVSRVAGAVALRLVGNWDIGGLDPKVALMFHRLQIVETLVGADDYGDPLPGLATSWTVSADGLVWRFELRKEVRFHDGSQLNGVDAAWVLERARTAPGALSLAPISAITADQDGVVIRLTRPFAPLPALLANPTTAVLARSAIGADGKVKAVIGSGPYRIAAIEQPLRVETAYFDGWRGPVPDVKAVSYLAVSRLESRTLIAQSRQADLVYALDATAARRIRSDPRNRLVDTTPPRAVIMNINAGYGALKDLRVRRAISLAIDRRGIATGVLRDPGLAATQLFPPNLPDWHAPGLTPLAYDPAGARALLASAGWTLGPDGIARRGRERLAFTLKTYPDRAEMPVLAAAVQEALRQIGIAVRLEIGNSADIPLSHRDGSLQLALASRNYGFVTDPTTTLLQDFGPQGGDWGATNWSSPATLQALEGLQRTTNAAERSALRATFARVVQAELPIVPISWYRERVAIGDRIGGGVSIDPLERSFRISDIRWKGGRP